MDFSWDAASVLDVSALTNLSGGSLVVVGAVVTLPGLQQADSASFYVSGGAVLTLPGLRSYQKPSRSSATWQASGAGSALVLPALTNVVGDLDCCWSLNLQANGGGQLVLSNVAHLDGRMAVTADGTGSLVDVSGATHLVWGAGFGVQFAAQNAGKVDLREVQSIGGGSCSLLADGTGSVIDLSSLSAFATPLGASSLTAQNGGTILLNHNVFLLVNVALNVPAGNPVLPPVVSAGPSLSLYGRAGHSYWIDVRDTREAGSPWQLYRRVPQTNDIQVIGGPPLPWQAFRVSEFVADPPIVDISPTDLHAAQLVLYGTPGRTFRVQSTDSIDVLPADWEIWATVADMTNSFRILPTFLTTEEKGFYRAARE